MSSAALLASALMAGSSFADDIQAPATISGIEFAESVIVSGSALIDGTGPAPTINASVSYDVSGGEIRDVDLTGIASFNKTGDGTARIGSGENGNSWEGNTNIVSGTLITTTDNALSRESITFLNAGATLDISDTTQHVGSLGDYFDEESETFAGGTVELGDTGALYAGYNDLSDIFDGTFSGGIHTVVTKVGEGTWFLTGDHDDFNGTLSVDEGILRLGDGTNGSFDNVSSLNIGADGELIVDLGNDGVLKPTSLSGTAVQLSGTLKAIASGTNTIDVRSSSLEGNGEFIQAGEGRTILLGDFNHTGNTYVESGVLQVGNQEADTSLRFSNIEISADATLDLRLNNSSLDGTIVNDGGIFVDSIGSVDFHEGITGTGSLTIASDYDAVISLHDSFGSNYTGNTQISSGTLRAADSAVLSRYSDHFLAYGAALDIANTSQRVKTLSGSGFVDMTDAYLALGDDDSVTIFDGFLDGSASTGYGIVEKLGKGDWGFDGHAYNVNVSVKEGVLAVGTVEGSSAYWQGNFIVEPDAFLAGHGFIDGTVINDGYVLPGALETGTLTIAGNYDQSETGSLLIRIAGKNSFDTLLVGQDAFLDGSLVVARTGKEARPGQKYVVLETPNGYVDGEFSVRNNVKTMVGTRALYEDDAVIVEFYQKSFAGLSGLTPNQREAAKALNRLSAEGKGRKLIDRLNNESISQVKRDIAILTPEDRAMIFNIGFATARIQTGNIERRLDDVRNGAYGFCANGLALSNSHGALNFDGMPVVNDRDGLSLAGWDGATVVEQKFYAPVMDISNRWGFFATGTGEWSDIESTRDVRGAEFTTGGVTVGADYRVADNFVVGISGNYANTSSDLWNDGSLDVNSGRGAVYASVFTNGLYGNALVGGGYNSYKTRSNTIGGTSRGSADGGEFDAYLGGGYDFRTESGFTIGPVASLQYTYIGLSNYTESGSDAPMTFPSQSQNSLRSTLGLRASYAFGYGEMVIRPEVRAQWGHEFLDSTTEIEAGFAAGGGTFRNTGQKIGRDSLLLDAGVVFEFSPNYSVFAYYTGELGRENYSSNGVNGGFRLNF